MQSSGMEEESRVMEQREAESPSFEDCLKLLKGERDEQRLVGLLLVTKFCKGDDFASLRMVYSAVGSHFLERLLRTGIGREPNFVNSEEDFRKSYFQLAVTVLAALCRVPDVSSCKEIISMIPLVIEAMPSSNPNVHEECFEFFYFVTRTNGGGAQKFYDSGGLKVVSSTIRFTLDGSRSVEFAIKVVHNVVSIHYNDLINGAYQDDLLSMILKITKQFANFHTSLKFQALRLLSYVFSFSCVETFHEALRSVATRELENYMRLGIMHILQNRVAPEDKLCALMLAEAMVSLIGENWLIGNRNESPIIKFLLLVLESSRVEIAVLLNELACANDTSSSKTEKAFQKQRHLGTLFFLIEKIIKLASDEENLMSTNVINGLNETADVVLDYLHDAEDHERLKGDDLIASVRLVGSYLAENPIALQEKVKKLLSYMLSVRGEDEKCPFDAICFLLPMLSQVTAEASECQVLVSTDSFVIIVECLVKMMDNPRENEASISLGCSVVINLLMDKRQMLGAPQKSCFVDLVKCCASWGETSDDPHVYLTAATVCSLILADTSQEDLLRLPNFDRSHFNDVAKLFGKSFAFCSQATSDVVEPHFDPTGYAQWSLRFPLVRDLVSKIVSNY